MIEWKRSTVDGATVHTSHDVMGANFINGASFGFRAYRSQTVAGFTVEGHRGGTRQMIQSGFATLAEAKAHAEIVLKGWREAGAVQRLPAAAKAGYAAGAARAREAVAAGRTVEARWGMHDAASRAFRVYAPWGGSDVRETFCAAYVDAVRFTLKACYRAMQDQAQQHDAHVALFLSDDDKAALARVAAIISGSLLAGEIENANVLYGVVDDYAADAIEGRRRCVSSTDLCALVHAARVYVQSLVVVPAGAYEMAAEKRALAAMAQKADANGWRKDAVMIRHMVGRYRELHSGVMNAGIAKQARQSLADTPAAYAEARHSLRCVVRALDIASNPPIWNSARAMERQLKVESGRRRKAAAVRRLLQPAKQPRSLSAAAVRPVPPAALLRQLANLVSAN